ncbi:MAG TPA: hypothetical protein V6D23_05815, partial [Candidatus Obscuribacterales bacterium]
MNSFSLCWVLRLGLLLGLFTSCASQPGSVDQSGGHHQQAEASLATSTCSPSQASWKNGIEDLVKNSCG